MLTRRTLLASAAPAMAIAAAGCTTAQVTAFQNQWNTVVTQIQSLVAQAASYVPTVETIAAEAAALFGPTYESMVTVGSAALNTIVQTLTNVVTALTPPAQATLRARLRASSPMKAVNIGTTPEGVAVTGFKV